MKSNFHSMDYIEAREAVAVEKGAEPTKDEVLFRMVQDEERKMDKAKETHNVLQRNC